MGRIPSPNSSHDEDACRDDNENYCVQRKLCAGLLKNNLANKNNNNNNGSSFYTGCQVLLVHCYY